jgi:hypothetical protein
MLLLYRPSPGIAFPGRTAFLNPTANTTWSESNTAKAQEIWDQFQKIHDLSELIGQTAGIDPQSGKVWIGHSIHDVLAKRDADGISSLLFFERIGASTYYRKGSRLRSRERFPKMAFRSSI